MKIGSLSVIVTLATSLTACADHPIVAVDVVEKTGWGANWSHANGKVVFNKPDDFGTQRLWLMNPDGSDEAQLGLFSATMPTRNAGSAVWHPSGKYIVFVAEKKDHAGLSVAATPGWGGYSDLWAATADGSRAWQLTDTPNDSDHGTLIPTISPDGMRVAWTERTKAGDLGDAALTFGTYALKIGDFVDGPDGPTIRKVRDVTPGGAAFYETGGFSHDSKTMLFTSDHTTHDVWKSQIFTMDMDTLAVTELTSDDYNEHPRFTPDGKVIWMSHKGSVLGGADWWRMNADGSNAHQLTCFDEPWDDESNGNAVWTGPVPTENWSDDGTWFLGDVETNLVTAAGEIRRVRILVSGS